MLYNYVSPALKTGNIKIFTKKKQIILHMYSVYGMCRRIQHVEN